RGSAGAGFRLAMAETESEGAGAGGSRQVFDRAAVCRTRVRDPGAGGGDGRVRKPGGHLVADNHLFPADARGAFAEPSWAERHVQTGAGAGRGLHDGYLVPLHQHRELAGGTRRRHSGVDDDADPFRQRRRLHHRRRSYPGAAGEADGAPDVRSEVTARERQNMVAIGHRIPVSSPKPGLAVARVLTGTGVPGRGAIATEQEVVGLFDQTRDRMLRYILGFGLSMADAEEIVQEVFLALFQHLAKGKPRDSLTGWVFRVAHNLALKRRQAASYMWVNAGSRG